MQHAVDGYSRRGYVSVSPVCGIVLIYSPDGAPMSDARGVEFEGIGSV